MGVVAVLFACASAVYAEKTIPHLIGDLAVQDPGNNTCNTACGILVGRGDPAVPALRGALRNKNERIRYYAVRCLGQINTQSARSALISAFSHGANDVREHAAYALTWNPARDAEEIYIEFLRGHDEWHVRHAIQALGQIRSSKAVPHLARIRDNPPCWHTYYTTIVALRKIESREFSPEIQTALDFLRQAKFSRDIDVQRLNDSAVIIGRNLQATVVDVFNLFLWVTKGNESPATPNAKTILHQAGPLAFPVIRIGLKDPDQNVSRKTQQLVEEFGWGEKLRGNPQPGGPTNGSLPVVH